MKKLTLLLFSILTLFFIAPSYSEEKFISGESRGVKVIDGDTIKINGEKVRLHGIDAPEMEQICQNENNNSYDYYTHQDYLYYQRKLIYQYYKSYNHIHLTYV